MIVCHCNCIMAVAIEQSARALGQISTATPTPEQVYGDLGMRPCCGGCLPLAEAIIAAALPTHSPRPTCEEQSQPLLLAAE
jgi:bacterioferritin-associated ferredoxin